MGILFSCCMNGNDSHTEHPDASIPKNDCCFRSVLQKFKQQIMQKNEYQDISSSSTGVALEDRNLDWNQPNIVAPQHVAISGGMCDNQVAEQEVTALVIEQNRGTEGLLDAQIEGMVPCCEALEDRNLDGNHLNIVVSAPQPSEFHVAVSTRMCDNQVAEPQVTTLVMEENRGTEDLLDTQTEVMQPCCEEKPKISPYLCSEEISLPDLCNQLYQVILSSDEEDVCPTCLEDYDPNNPKIVTECSHHFHLSCIYAWMERSNTCPICFRVMVFDEAA